MTMLGDHAQLEQLDLREIQGDKETIHHIPNQLHSCLRVLLLSTTEAIDLKPIANFTNLVSLDLSWSNFDPQDILYLPPSIIKFGWETQSLECTEAFADALANDSNFLPNLRIMETDNYDSGVPFVGSATGEEGEALWERARRSAATLIGALEHRKVVYYPCYPQRILEHEYQEWKKRVRQIQLHDKRRGKLTFAFCQPARSNGYNNWW